MKVLYVASLAHAPDRDSGWIQSFESLGHQVIKVSSTTDDSKLSLLNKMRRRFHLGIDNYKMQRDVVKLAIDNDVDWVHFRLPLEFGRRALLKLRQRGIVLTQYFNDDLYSPKAVPFLYWKIRKNIAFFDGNFVYRHHNVEEYLKNGAEHAMHCPPCYNPNIHFIDSSISHKITCDAAFVGHWEADGRADYLNALIDNGFSVTIKGGLWDEGLRRHPLREKVCPINHAFGQEYRKIYSTALAGICFFSKINRDTLTERVFEIVAVGGLLVCERTDEAMMYFKDRKEALFFSDIEELIDILNWLKLNPIEREKIKSSGYERLKKDGNTTKDRARMVSSFAADCINKKLKYGV